MPKPANILIMGICGTGKSTISALVAERLGLPMIEADRFHPPANIEKMAAGQPLDDDDRAPWLDRLAAVLAQHEATGFVLACSALKAKYRQALSANLSAPLTVFYLQGSKALIAERMAKRQHFMPASLIDSQLADLELTPELIPVDIVLRKEAIAERIVSISKAKI